MILKNRLYNLVVMAFAFLLLMSAVPALSKEEPPRDEPDPGYDELMKLVDASLPDIIKEDNSGLVSILLKPRIGPPLRKVFNSSAAIKTLFGRKSPTIAPGCKKINTPSGDIDPDECQASYGQEAGEGAYLEFRYSKNMSLGNLSFFDRPAVMEITPAGLIPIRMTDDEAYQKALAFFQQTFGLPTEEIPTPPQVKAQTMLPVRTIALGGAVGDKPWTSVPVEKMVILQRGLYVGLGGEYGEYEWIPGPGRAVMVLGDKGVVREALVRGWQEVKPHPEANPEFAKGRTALKSEIARDLMNESTGMIYKLNSRLVYSSIPSPSGAGLLLPAVQVHVSPVPADLTEEEQHKLAMKSTAGLVRTYNLVGLNETNPKGEEME